MKNHENICRFCLKITDLTDLVSLFSGEIDNLASIPNWLRIFSFVYYYDDVPRNICRSCKVQIDWMAGYYQKVLENDCYLRSQVVMEEAMNMNNEIFDEQPIISTNVEVLENMNTEFQPYNAASNLELAHLKMEQDSFFGKDVDLDEVVGDIEPEDVSSHLYSTTGYDVEEDAFEPHQEFQPISEELKSLKEQQNIHEDEMKIETSEPQREGIGDGNIDVKNNAQGCFTCDICNKKFTLKRYLKRHEKIHNTSYEPNLKCDKCGKMFCRKDFRDEHVKAFHEGLAYRCPVCDFTKNWKHRIAKHIKQLHPGEKTGPIEIKM